MYDDTFIHTQDFFTKESPNPNQSLFNFHPKRDEKENSQIVSVDRVSTLTEKYYYKTEYLSTSKISSLTSL